MLTTKNYQEFQVLSEDGTLEKTFTGVGHRCLPGDLVDMTPDGISLKKRNQPNPLVGTIHIQSKYLFGHTSRNVPIYLFFPYDISYPPMRVGCSAKDGKNKIGLVIFESWDKGETYPRGILQQVLGDAGELEVEQLALKYNYAPEWKKMMKYPESSIPINRNVRIPLTGFSFNIDPPGCKDIDDCLTIRQVDDRTEIIITIADLTEVVLPGSDMDILAQRQGCTLYSPTGEAIAPMLPRWISEQEASLIPGQERRGLSLSMQWDGKDLHVFGFFPSVFTNSVSYTYESVYENESVCKILKEITSCEDSHKWVEYMMVLYNQHVADIFLQHNIGLLRKLESTSLKRLEQKAAEYCLPSADAVHAGLQNKHYTHATSPIRRYADILAQRYLLSIIQYTGTTPQKPTQLTLQNLNHRMKQASRFERDLCFLQAVSKSSLGTVEGTVLDWKPSKDQWKVYIEVPEWNQILTLRMKGTEEDNVLHLQSPDEQEVFHVRRDSSTHVKYYCDRSQPNWKKRMVFSLC
jgi:exoribonuclease R